MPKSNSVVKFDPRVLVNIVLYASATVFAVLACFNAYQSYDDPGFTGFGTSILVGAMCMALGALSLRLYHSPVVREDMRAIFYTDRPNG